MLQKMEQLEKYLVNVPEDGTPGAAFRNTLPKLLDYKLFQQS